MRNSDLRTSQCRLVLLKTGFPLAARCQSEQNHSFSGWQLNEDIKANYDVFLHILLSQNKYFRLFKAIYHVESAEQVVKKLTLNPISNF